MAQEWAKGKWRLRQATDREALRSVVYVASLDDGLSAYGFDILFTLRLHLGTLIRHRLTYNGISGLGMGRWDGMPVLTVHDRLLK